MQPTSNENYPQNVPEATYGEEIFQTPYTSWGTEQSRSSEIPPMNPPDLVNWFLSFPSVPLSLRKRFIAFWEMIPLGNFTENDIKKLEVKFNGLLLDLLMSIPDEEWNSVFKFEGQGVNEESLEMDLNTLFSMLKIIFYTQLTRGRKGFTARLMGGHPLTEGEKKKEWKITLF